ncbi:MAG: hypothetical protein FJ161_03100 [Gammaproteobacteria bacterium]|nr:hypothetical protein [Gammaproteobacteria bacterium]
MSSDLKNTIGGHDHHLYIVPNQRLQQWMMYRALNIQKLPMIESFCMTDRQFIQECLLHDVNWQETLLLDDLSAVLWIADHIKNDHSQKHLLDLAQATYKAYQKLLKFNVTLNQCLNYLPNPSQKAFVDRMTMLTAAAQKEQIIFLDQAIKAFANGLIKIPAEYQNRKVIVYGFDEITPLHQAFFEQIHSQGLLIEYEDIDTITVGNVKKYQYNTAQEELTDALLWLKKQPVDSVSAIVISDLEVNYQETYHSILSILDPEIIRLPLTQVSAQFSISHGEPLLTYPLVQDLLNQIEQQHDQVSKNFYEWIMWLKNKLIESQWGQKYTLSSAEYQLVQSVWKLIEKLQSLSALFNVMSFNYFLFLFKSALSLHIFQPQSLNNHHMVLGLLEAAALPLDAVWLLRSDRSRFPQSLSKDLLIPALLQEKYNFPHAHIQREATYLQSVLKRLFRKDRTCQYHLSYASYDAKGHECNNSFVIDDLIPSEYIFIEKQTPIIIPSTVSKISFETQEKRESHAPLALSASQLNAFYQCPFLGWAKTLNNSEPSWLNPKALFDPRVFGQVVHQWTQSVLVQNSPILWPEAWPSELITHVRDTLETLRDKVFIDFRPDLYEYQVEKVIYYQSEFFKVKGRIDIYCPQQHTIVDIKLRSQSVSKVWARSEPQDWQGPIYALAHAHEETKLGLLHLAKNDYLYTLAPVHNYFAEWELLLKNLYESWNSGQYEPMPRDSNLCKKCAYRFGCRFTLSKEGDLNES